MPGSLPDASLDLTHVLYDESSHVSLVLALLTLSPILLMPAYAALAYQTREFTIITMWAGQWACEGLNWILKHLIKEERPADRLGHGYGFPSSHSQYMGYFSTFLVCHMFFTHKFGTTGNKVFDELWRMTAYLGIVSWAVVVAYSRYYLGYHTPAQILWGFGIGVLCGLALYIVAEYVPRRKPSSLLNQLKTAFLCSSVADFLQIRDGWAVWADGGREDEWKRWKEVWSKRTQ